MHPGLVAILVGTVLLAAVAIWLIWRMRRGNTTVQRWQSSLPWIGWIVLVIATLSTALVDSSIIGPALLIAIAGIGVTAIALGLASWMQGRNARARDVELGYPPIPHRPGLIMAFALVAIIAPFCVAMIVLPWLAMIAYSPPYPDLLSATGMLTTVGVGYGVGAVIVVTRWIAYTVRKREYDSLVRGIEQRVADARTGGAQT